MLRLASHQQCNRHPLKQAYGDGSWFFLTSPKLSRWDLPKRPNVGVVDWNAPFIYPENSVWSPRNPRNPGIRAVSPARQARVEKAWLSLPWIVRSSFSDSDVDCAQAFAWPSDVS